MKKKLSERKRKWIERTVANDRSYKLFLYNRFFTFLGSALLQLAAFIFFMFLIVYHSQYAVVFQLLMFALQAVFLLYILNKFPRPSCKMGWILLIVLLPFFGVPWYLFNGMVQPTRKMRKKLARAKEENQRKIKETYGETPSQTVENRADAISAYLSNYADYPTFAGGEVTYYKAGEEMFPDMLSALEKAEKFVLLEYFIIAHGKMWSEIRKILLEKAAQGVQIRIIYDDFGCIKTLPPRYERYLEMLSENIKCVTFNDVIPMFALRMNNRDHRKILVIDGKVAFTGGINIADEYIAEKQRFGYWKDTGVRVKGDAVSSFTRMFMDMWNAFSKEKEDVTKYLLPYAGTHQLDKKPLRILPYDNSPLTEPNVAEAVYADMINRAQKYVWIFTPYLVLDEYMRATLCAAAMRGVDVRIVTPAIPDKKIVYRMTRANYGVLMQAGVKIYEYTPGFIHAKNMLCDGESAVVGTINLDYRSLYHHFENAVYFSGCEAVKDVERDCNEVFALSRLCTEKDMRKTWLGKFIDAILRVFETLL
ncbi:MAG: cardiolipin synthase [Clostridiales bacterium]|nr:cardiolipin synthase [Clostridiales bacterium]